MPLIQKHIYWAVNEFVGVVFWRAIYMAFGGGGLASNPPCPRRWSATSTLSMGGALRNAAAKARWRLFSDGRRSSRCNAPVVHNDGDRI